MRLTLLLVLVLALAATACQREAANEAPAAAPAPAETEAANAIIPLESVLKSQRASVSQRIANTDISITYSRPVARGRELFGALVPYGEPWTPGADRATMITVDRDVTVNGQPLAAGSYSIWAVPGADAWAMMFHRDADRFHLPYPGDEGVALRVDGLKPEPGQHMETLAWYFPVVEGKDAVLRLHWGETVIPLNITVP